MDSGESCSICFDPLGKLPFGVCAPCGHCFHHDCFGTWEAQCIANQASNRNSRKTKKIPCPNCNTPTDCFVRKLFLNISGGATGDDMVDRDEGFGAARSEHGEENGSAEAAKWKKRANELKGTERSLRESCRDLALKHRTALSERDELGKKAKSLQGQCDYLAKEVRENQNEVSEAFVAVERAERLRNELEKDRNELQTELVRRREDIKSLQKSLANIKNRYETDLARLETHDMVEIEEVLSQHPKLKQANHSLRAALAMKTKEAKDLESRLKSLGKTNATRLETSSSCTSQRRTNNAEMVARGMQHIRREEDKKGRQTQKRKRAEERNQEGVAASRKRLSMNATRIVRAAKKVAPSRTHIATAALQVASAKKTPRQSTVQNHQASRRLHHSNLNYAEDSSDDDKPIQSRSCSASRLFESAEPSAGFSDSRGSIRQNEALLANACPPPSRAHNNIAVEVPRRENATSGTVLVGMGDFIARGPQQKIKARRKGCGSDIRSMFRTQSR